MAIQSIQFQPVEVGFSHGVIFSGDNVTLAGQIDYPNLPAPQDGYPLLFILPNACCTGRKGFKHHMEIGIQAGFAVFRWDKRGTGRSASGGQGSTEQGCHTRLSDSPSTSRHQPQSRHHLDTY